jgi:hypothetical protein
VEHESRVLSHGDGADADQVEESAFLTASSPPLFEARASAAEAPLAALVALTTEVLKNRREAIEAAIASGDEVRCGWGGWGLFLQLAVGISACG